MVNSFFCSIACRKTINNEHGNMSVYDSVFNRYDCFKGQNKDVELKGTFNLPKELVEFVRWFKRIYIFR